MTEQQDDCTTKAQTIFRVEKNKENPFVMIDRRVIENPKLSWKAKGLLAYLLSRPDNWVVRFRDLVKRAPDKAHTVRAAMKELRAAGHVKVEAEREKGRVKQWVYTIHESPDVEFQQVEIQQVENHTLNNNESGNDTDLTDIGDGPPLPLDWQIGMGVETISLPDEKEARMKDVANLIATGTGATSTQYYSIALAFMKSRQIVIPPSKVKGQRKAIREMIDSGVMPSHVEEAVQKLVKDKLTVSDLFSVSKTAISMANPAPDESAFPPPTGTYATAEEVEAEFREQGLIS
jgi:hypothetical protein